MADMFPGAIGSFLLASALIELTPGPNMGYLALTAAKHGRLAGAATVLGVAIGLLTIGVLSAIGVGELITASRAAYETLRWAGILFLLYLAWEGWHGEDRTHSSKRGRPSSHFLRGLVTNLLNPKAAICYVTVLPTFMDANGGVRQALTLTTVYVSVATIAHTAVVALAGALQPVLDHPVHESVARRVMSGLLAAIAVWFAATSSR